MPAYETNLGHGVSVITLAPEEEFAEVAGGMLPLYDRLLADAEVNKTLPEKDLKKIRGWNAAAHQIFNDWSSGERPTLRGLTFNIDSGLHRLMPESPEKRDTLRRLSTAAVNTFGLT